MVRFIEIPALPPDKPPAADKKPRAVIILGAGAVADFGVPLLRGVFKDAEARKYLASNDWLRKQLDDAFWKPRGHTLETSDQTITVEEMLTVLGDCKRQHLPHQVMGVEDEARLRQDLNVLIFNALFVGKNTQSRHLNPLISYARKHFAHTTWASFNWDCIFESSYWYSSGGPGYGTRRNPKVVVPLQGWSYESTVSTFLKLHGGVNWWVQDGKLHYISFGGVGNELVKKWEEYGRGRLPPEVRPAILEPSVYKYEDPLYKMLEPQWERFFEDLVGADVVLIVGYSLPPLDAQARAKITMAFQMNDKARWAVIDPSTEVANSYRRLLGKDRLYVMESGLAGFNNAIEANMHAAFPMLPVPEPDPLAATPGAPAKPGPTA